MRANRRGDALAYSVGPTILQHKPESALCSCFDASYMVMNPTLAPWRRQRSDRICDDEVHSKNQRVIDPMLGWHYGARGVAGNLLGMRRMHSRVPRSAFRVAVPVGVADVDAGR
jgi:hypothetical protein